MTGDDKKLIQQFVEFVQPGLKVDRWPDLERDGDIDAIAGTLAIEHTSVDVIPNQRQHLQWFNDLCTSVETQLANESYPFSLKLVIPYEVIVQQKDRATLAAQLVDWCKAHAELLNFGMTEIPSTAELGMRLRAVKRRTASLKATLSLTLEPIEVNFQELLQKKLKKLRRYSYGYTTVLLIESYEIVLFDPEDLRGELKTLFQKPDQWNPDQIWLADTAIGPADFTHLTPQLRL